jgi:hypothetical protein
METRDWPNAQDEAVVRPAIPGVRLAMLRHLRADCHAQSLPILSP